VFSTGCCLQVGESTPLQDAFLLADDVLRQGVQVRLYLTILLSMSQAGMMLLAGR